MPPGRCGHSRLQGTHPATGDHTRLAEQPRTSFFRTYSMYVRARLRRCGWWCPSGGSCRWCLETRRLATGDWQHSRGKAAASCGWVLGDEITRIPLPASRLCPPGRSKPVEPSRNPTFVDPTTRRRAHVPTGRPRQRSPPNTTCAQPLERIAFPLLAAGACHNLILKRITCPLQSPFGPSLACWTDPALNIRTLSLPRLPLPALLTGIAPSALQTLARTSKFSSLIPTTTPQESLAIHFVPFVHSALPRATCCCESPDACATTRWHAALA